MSDFGPGSRGDTPRPGIAPTKSAWRRFFEVAAPVAVFALAAPLAVNGFATAVNKAAPTSEQATGAAETTLATVSTTTAVSVVADEAVPISIAGLAENADDRTISLATEIVAASPATSTAANSNATGSTTSTTAIPNGEGHAHGGVTAEVPLTRGERSALAAELSTAREAGALFATVAAAEAAGYTLVTGYIPLIGAHYIKWGLMDTTFDPASPEMLLYDGTSPDSSIVGLSYYLFSASEPSPFTGANDHWHQHIGLCIKDGVVVGGERTTPAECTARGGTKAGAENGWMAHAWVVPGWESPQGVFSPEHIGLTADLPTS